MPVLSVHFFPDIGVLMLTLTLFSENKHWRRKSNRNAAMSVEPQKTEAGGVGLAEGLSASDLLKN